MRFRRDHRAPGDVHRVGVPGSCSGRDNDPGRRLAQMGGGKPGLSLDDLTRLGPEPNIQADIPE